MEAAISAYFGLLSPQKHWGETACPPLFLKKIEWAVI